MFGNNFSKYDFGNRLAERRKVCGYKSQTDLATRMVSACTSGDEYARHIESKRKSISNWESGKHEPSVSDFALLCELLDCDPEFLLGDSKTPRKEIKSTMEVTGLSEQAISKLQKENGSVCLRHLSKLLGQQEFWEILHTFARLDNFASHDAEQNKERSELYWSIVQSGEHPEECELYRRVAISLDKARYNYELERYQCQILFKTIVDKFLPTWR